ncbi:hypothetical protein [Streptomyces sp. NPDC059349]|uniref:hypothetical protein n=1 Tax=Streptomyces sp. NPDC059349 TaxID=3346808 RepID=UPI00367DC891
MSEKRRAPQQAALTQDLLHGVVQGAGRVDDGLQGVVQQVLLPLPVTQVVGGDVLQVLGKPADRPVGALLGIRGSPTGMYPPAALTRGLAPVTDWLQDATPATTAAHVPDPGVIGVLRAVLVGVVGAAGVRRKQATQSTLSLH